MGGEYMFMRVLVCETCGARLLDQRECSAHAHKSAPTVALLCAWAGLSDFLSDTGEDFWVHRSKLGKDLAVEFDILFLQCVNEEGVGHGLAIFLCEVLAYCRI